MKFGLSLGKPSSRVARNARHHFGLGNFLGGCEVLRIGKEIISKPVRSSSRWCSIWRLLSTRMVGFFSWNIAPRLTDISSWTLPGCGCCPKFLPSKDLIESPGVDMYQGRLGAQSPKPTFCLVGNAPGLSAFMEQFDFIYMAAGSGIGLEDDGSLPTPVFKEYPRLCAAIAHTFVKETCAAGMHGSAHISLAQQLNRWCCGWISGEVPLIRCSSHLLAWIASTTSSTNPAELLHTKYEIMKSTDTSDWLRPVVVRFV